MSILITHKEPLGTGAYILNPVAKSYVPFKSTAGLFLTQEANDSLKQEIIALIREAKAVLKICSFIITDAEVYEAILERAKSKTIAIFILTQLDQKKIANLDSITEEELKGRSEQVHLNFIKGLYDQGGHVRASTSAHAKFIIADRNRAFLMSANLTTPSLTLNTESGFYLGIREAAALDKLFDVIFQSGTTYRRFVNAGKKNKQFIIQADINVKEQWLPKGCDSNLRYTYESLNNSLYESIVEIVRTAQEFLFISTYSIVGIDKLEALVKEIKEAVGRGVKITIFCRGMNYRLDHLKGTLYLANLGCTIYGDMYNHSKGVISERRGMTFTANIDGNHGLLNGFEVGCILEEAQRMEFLEFHHYLVDTSVFSYSTNPSRVEFFDTYAHYEGCKKINAPQLPDNLEIHASANVKSKEDLEKYPLYLGFTKDKRQVLVAGNSYYRCSYDSGRFYVEEPVSPILDMERYLLKFTNLKIYYN